VTEAAGGVMRFGSWLFGLFLLVLPTRLRGRAGAEMREAFDARQREAADRGGAMALVGVWARELTGVLATAVRARGGDMWLRRADRVLGRAGEMPVCVAGRHGGGLMDTVVRDIRFAIRAATRRPGAYALALVACALGIGATTGMFSVVDGVLWRSLPYPDADRIVSVYLTNPQWKEDADLNAYWRRAWWSYPEYVEWRGLQNVFEQAAAYRESRSTITGSGEPQRIPVGRVSPELFPMLGTSPVVGRVFNESDGEDASANVVILSNGFWKSHFGGDRGVVGSEIRLDNSPYTVVGVLPERFSLADMSADVWMVIGGPPDERRRQDHSLRVVARLKPGVSAARAEEETAGLLSGVSSDHTKKHGAFVIGRQEDETWQVRTPLEILLGASLLLLAVSCVTVASLMLGISMDREHELAVRSAIGAGRGRVVRQLVTESLVLSAASCTAGVAIALVLTKALVLLAPPGIPRLDDVSVDSRALLFATIASTLVGIAFGLVPALSVTKGQLVERMRRHRVTASRRLHATLVVAQLALACMLLIGAGLLARTLVKLDHVDPGFDATDVLTLRVDVPFRRFYEGDEFNSVAYDQVFDQLREAAAALPGVQATGLTTILPYADDNANNVIEPEGYVPQEGERIIAQRYYVSPNYMDLMRMRLVDGRYFTDADNRPDVAPVTIVTENVARRFWPGESAVGHTIRFYGGTLTIVGVIADIRDRTLLSAEDYRQFMPRGQQPGSGGSFVIRLRPGTDPASVVPILRRRVWSIEPDAPITSTAMLRERISDSLVEQRYRARLIWVFAATAGVFAVLGVYGVTSRSVASRTREIGIRIVLGERHIVRLVLRQGLLLAAAGAVIGLVAGGLASRVLSSFLFETEPTDPVTLGSVALGLALLSLIASIGPSRRAAGVDPIVAIRTE